MEILYIDPFAGCSGDMFLGALVDLGVDFEDLREALRSLGVKGFDLRLTATKRHSIAATKIDVVVEDVPHPHRHLKDLVAIVEKAPLPDIVKELSTAALARLAVAEARAHAMPVEQVHLHEVGGLDCLVDIVGTILGVEALGVQRIYSAPVAVGSGTVRCAHGVMPAPAPGTLAILENFPIRRTQIPHEMTTPTGAALIATLAEPAAFPFVLTPRHVGHGAGSRDTPEIANFLRLVHASVDPRHLPGARQEHAHDHAHDHEHGHDHEHSGGCCGGQGGGCGHEHDHDHEHQHGSGECCGGHHHHHDPDHDHEHGHGHHHHH
jgi:uncharacterized protein (TIGR00299 family) protein